MVFFFHSLLFRKIAAIKEKNRQLFNASVVGIASGSEEFGIMASRVSLLLSQFSESS